MLSSPFNALLVAPVVAASGAFPPGPPNLYLGGGPFEQNLDGPFQQGLDGPFQQGPFQQGPFQQDFNEGPFASPPFQTYEGNSYSGQDDHANVQVVHHESVYPQQLGGHGHGQGGHGQGHGKHGKHGKHGGGGTSNQQQLGALESVHEEVVVIHHLKAPTEHRVVNTRRDIDGGTHDIQHGHASGIQHGGHASGGYMQPPLQQRLGGPVGLAPLGLAQPILSQSGQGYTGGNVYGGQAQQGYNQGYTGGNVYGGQAQQGYNRGNVYGGQGYDRANYYGQGGQGQGQNIL